MAVDLGGVDILSDWSDVAGETMVTLFTWIAQALVPQEPTIVTQSASWTTVVLALIAIIPTTVGAIISGMVLLQTKRNAEVAAQTDKKVDEVKADGTANGEKLTEIHTLTNSNLTKVQSQLEVSNKTIEGLNQAQVESAKRMASMEALIASLVPKQGTQSPSEINGAKLDNLQSMLSNVQHGTPPIPVKDDAVLKKLEEVTIITDKKLDTIQETVEHPAKEK